MGNKKKRDRPDVEDVIARPWCYYCERDFDDQKVLISHQKAKHFKCDQCNRRLNTAGGLQVHLQQVHKATLTAVDNAIEGRQNISPEIFGMMGIPDELVEAHRQRILNEFFKQEAERRALTGNPPPGQGQPNAKKRKMETPEELKARLAEHRAKRQAEREAAAVQKSSSSTPDPAQSKRAPSATDFMPNPPQTYDPTYDLMHPRPLFDPLRVGLPFVPPRGPPGYQSGQWPPNMPPSFSPPQGAPYATPPFSMPPAHSPVTAHMPNVSMPSHHISSAPPKIVRQPSVLQPAPGLPARPSFDPPSFNREDMQRMHTGQVPPPAMPRKLPLEKMSEDTEKMLKDLKNGFSKKQASDATANAAQEASNEAAVSAPDTQAAPAVETAVQPVVNPVVGPPVRQKRPGILIYNHHDESPEQKLAIRSKYAFRRNDA